MRYRLGTLLVAVVLLAGCTEPADHSGAVKPDRESETDVADIEKKDFPDVHLGMDQRGLFESLKKAGWGGGPCIVFLQVGDVREGGRGPVWACTDLSSLDRGLVVEFGPDPSGVSVIQRFVFTDSMPQSREDMSYKEEIWELLESSGQ